MRAIIYTFCFLNSMYIKYLKRFYKIIFKKLCFLSKCFYAWPIPTSMKLTFLFKLSYLNFHSLN